jgi:exodeoxyribonuclease VII small subunit
MTSKKSTPFHFESALAALNQLVEKLEKGGLPLEESLRDFEQGVALTRQCQKALQQAEQKVKILLEKNGQSTLVPYDAESDAGDE